MVVLDVVEVSKLIVKQFFFKLFNNLVNQKTSDII